MRNLKLNYSVCQYTPDPLRQETINIGIAFHCPDEDHEYSNFIRIKNKRRIRSFDDEYDVDYMDTMFESLDYQFNYIAINEHSIPGIDEFTNINEDTFLESKTKFFVNEIQFLPTKKMYTTIRDIERDISDITKTYLYYDQPKSERISNEDVRRLIKKHIVRSKLKEQLIATKLKDYENNEIFDFEYDETLIKVMSFDYKQTKSLSTNIKSFLFDINDNKELIKNKEVKIITNDNFDSKNQHNELSIKKIKANGIIDFQILNFSEYIESVNKLVSK